MIGAGPLRALAPLSIWLMVTAGALSKDAVRLYESGDYMKAAALAETDKTATAHAFAARATLAHAIYIATASERASAVQKGADLARKALAMDPRNVEAHLQLVIALHRKTLEKSPTEAFFQGLANEAYDHLQTAVGLEPENPWVNSLLGGWHFEVVRMAGPALAAFLMDAGLKDGRAAFARALRARPDSIVIRYEFARALLLDDPEANRAEAENLLKAALRIAPDTHLKKLIATRAGMLLETMTNGSINDLMRLLRRLSA